MCILEPVIALLKSINPFESEQTIETKQYILTEKKTEKTFLDIAADFFDIMHQGMCIEENTIPIAPSEKHLKDFFIKSAHTINQIAQFIFRLTIDVVLNPFNVEESITHVNFPEHLEIEPYNLKITFSKKDVSKYNKIHEKYIEYLEKKPSTRLNSNNIFFDNSLNQILLNLSLTDLQNFWEIDPGSNERIFDITWGMEPTYKFFGVLVEIK